MSTIKSMTISLHFERKTCVFFALFVFPVVWPTLKSTSEISFRFLFVFFFTFYRFFSVWRCCRYWMDYVDRSRVNTSILTRRLCRNRSCDDNELYRSNSFKFERFRREDANDGAVANTLPKQVSAFCFRLNIRKSNRKNL